MKMQEKNVRLVSVETTPDYVKDSGLLCVVKVSVEGERPKDFDKLPLRIRARYQHAKGQNVSKYFFVQEFANEIAYLDENDTENEFTAQEHEQLQKWAKAITTLSESEKAEDIEKVGKVIQKYLATFACTDGLLPIVLTTAPVSEVVKGTQYEGVTAVTVESNGNDVVLNEITDFNFVANDEDAEIRYLRNSLLQQIANGDAIPNGKAKAKAEKVNDTTEVDDDLGI